MTMSGLHVHIHVHAAFLCPCVGVGVHVLVCVCVYVGVCINVGMPNCPASNQSSTEMKKTNDAGTGPVPDQAYAFWHFFVWYRTESTDARMPIYRR